MAEIVIPYRPRPLQLEIHKGLDDHRFGLLVCHRRFGKSVAVINQLVKGAVTCTAERPRFAYIAPLYRQAKAIAWDYLRKYTSVIPGVRAFESELRVDMPNGARVQLFGADNPDALRGMYLDGAALDEFGQMNARAWGEVIRPCLSDRNGWAVILGTPQGKNAFWDMHQRVKDDPAWFCRTYRASETGIIADEELDMLKRDMDPDEYAQEYECSWSAAIKGAYYARLLDKAREDKRICRVPIEPDLLTETWWDIGSANTAIWWVQPHRTEVRVVDYWASNDTTTSLPDLSRKIKAWAEEHNVTYDAHRAPHDIGVQDWSTDVSRMETAARLGIQFIQTPKLAIDDGIEAVKNLIPRCLFDEERCSGGLDALWHYQADINQRTSELKSVPLHNWASHGADAFRTGAVGLGRGPGIHKPPRRVRRGPSWATA